LHQPRTRHEVKVSAWKLQFSLQESILLHSLIAFGQTDTLGRAGPRL
jgi:hypothetical protein